MNKAVLIVAIAASTVLCQMASALDSSRIWLPKKYASLKPRLIAVANEAEASDRCLAVLSGEMIVRKNTDQHYYFIVTCRDVNMRSYTLSYLSPVAGGKSQLLSEQRSPSEQVKAEAVAIAETGVNEEQGLLICKNEIIDKIDNLDGLRVDDQSAVSKKTKSGFSYEIPFTAKTDLGNPVLYKASCNVDLDGRVKLLSTLQSQGALAICRDEVRAEAIILGRILFSEKDFVEQVLEHDQGFRYELPFDVKNRIGTVIRYGSECVVSSQEDVQVSFYLEESGALAVCKDSLTTETLLMKSVEFAEQADGVKTDQGTLRFEIPFTAKDPEGNERSFKGFCDIDEEGATDVYTEIDKAAILSVCIDDLKLKTGNMRSVELLEDQISPLEELEDGAFITLIPFNARSPVGTQLNYQAECTVNASGLSRIKLAKRK